MCLMQYVNLTEAAGLLADLWPSATHGRYLTSCFGLSASLMQMPPGGKQSRVNVSVVRLCRAATLKSGIGVVRREGGGSWSWVAAGRLINVLALSCFEHMTKGNSFSFFFVLFCSVQSAQHRGFSFFLNFLLLFLLLLFFFFFLCFFLFSDCFLLKPATAHFIGIKDSKKMLH